jgi:hypothetical protein
VVLGACSAGLATFRTGWRRATLAAVTVYQVHVWANHLLFDSNEDVRQVWLFYLALTLLLLLYIWIVLNLPGVRKEFKR